MKKQEAIATKKLLSQKAADLDVQLKQSIQGAAGHVIQKIVHDRHGNPRSLTSIRAEDIATFLLGYASVLAESAAIEWPENVGLPKFKIELTDYVVEGDLTLPNNLRLPKLSFNSCVFLGQVSFIDVVFTESASFRNVAFRGYATFQSAKFFRSADFRECTFAKKVSFRDSTFKKIRPKFIDTVFEEFASFKAVKFGYGANFTRAKFCDFAQFVDAVFLNRGIFMNTVFESNTQFSNCQFFGAPEFHEADLHAGTNFFGATYDKAKKLIKPSNEESPDAENESETSLKWVERDQIAFRTLKQKMAAIRAHREEAMFFALELRAERDVEGFLKSPVKWIVNFSYDALSVYGQSPGRAVASFVCVNLAFSLIYALWSFVSNVMHAPGIISTSSNFAFSDSPWLALSLQNVFNPIALFSEKSVVTTNSPWVFGLSLIQTITSLSILALLLLAIRGNFQKGSGGGS